MSSFPPRECGIATFTQDLINAIDKEYSPEIKSKVLAINDNGTSIYNYPKKVSLDLYESEIENYLNRAHEINKRTDIKLVNIQHEFGLFGGDWGDYLLAFLELITKPVVVTFHTVLPHPDEKLKSVTKGIANKAYKIVVMTKISADILQKYYQIPKNKIAVIPHGVHHIAFPSKGRAKKKLNLNGRLVLSTFGLLNQDKGIEYAIEALPEIVKEHPNLLYLVIGETHPVVRREDGEVYRKKLKKLVVKLGLTENVKFYDRYLNLKELIDYLKATDIYISPTLNPRQAVSGTISYALSCACPVIATANQYAKGVINKERGRLVKFKNSASIKTALKELLSDKKIIKEMGRNSYFYSRHMTWQNVAISYFNIFNEFAKIVPREKGKLPPINLGHIRSLTDNFGMIQFAHHTKADPNSGYCLDDNARVLLAFSILYDKKPSKNILKLIDTYFNFVKFVSKKDGRFKNLVEHQDMDLNNTESEDALGRAIWGLGYVSKSLNLPVEYKEESLKMLKKSIPHLNDLHSLRAIAFSLIGLNYSYEKNKDEQIKNTIINLSDNLVRHFEEESNKKGKKWDWFENCLTYSNYKLPEALLTSYNQIKDKKYLKIAEKSLKFLTKVTFEKDFFSPIGQDGWYFRGGKRSYFDQQPEDAATATEALSLAYKITKKKIYKQQAELAFNWFLGKNHLSQMVYDEATGGSYDGMGKYSLNFNQGAESTIAYLLARLSIEDIYK